MKLDTEWDNEHHNYWISYCRHCGKSITRVFEDCNLWHDSSSVFPQYCATDEKNPEGSQLHEPMTTAEMIAKVPAKLRNK